jgi:uncharacterized OsmC-like protein
MSNLREYLAQKRAAILQKRANPVNQPNQLKASTQVEGRSGIRRIRIRNFQIISDSPADFAGYDLGPSSPELQLGVLSSCLSHIFLIQAADRQVPLDALRVEVTAEQDPRAGQPGFENVPIYPHNIAYTAYVTSPASDEELQALYEAVEQACPILNLLKNPQTLTGTIVHDRLPEQAVAD